MTEVTTEALETIFTGILQRAQDELAVITDPAELERYWYFKYDKSRSPAVNLYEFNKLLDLYRSQCRRWEELHNGSSCVVERVRDQYLMPKIREFLAELLVDSQL